MWAKILATAASKLSHGEGYCLPAVDAARRCIERAGIDQGEIDVLINVGIYRDQNICEPALATLIQQQLALNPAPHTSPEGPKTLSFDLLNGACGFFSAVQVARTLLATGSAQRVLIVACDLHPSRATDPTFPFEPTGAAMLLALAPRERQGFEHVGFSTAPDSLDAMRGYTDVMACGNQGRNRVTVAIQKDFADRALLLCIRTVRQTITAQRLNPRRLKLISTLPSLAHDQKLACALELDPAQVINLREEYGAVHTSAMILGYDLAVLQGAIEEHDSVLFVGVGSGITASVGLYVV